MGGVISLRLTGYAVISPLWAVASVGVYGEAVGTTLSAALAALVWAGGLLPASIAAAVAGPPVAGPDEEPFDDVQMVLVCLPAAIVDDGWDIGELELDLCEVVEPQGLGRCDGDEIGPDGYTLFFVGPDAESMFAAMEPVLRSDPVAAGARVELYACWPDERIRIVHLAVAV